MSPDRWQKVNELFEAALNLDPSERSDFLRRACPDDDQLRQQVESLLSSDQHDGGMLEKPAYEAAAEMIAQEHGGSVIGRIIGRYRVTARLGAGGMGEVYLAQDLELGRKVALKLLPSHLTRDQEKVQRFRQEARAVSALNHPNIVTIHEVGRFEDHYFIVTEHIEGETLRRRMADDRLPLTELLDIAIQTAAALAAAHQAGVIHRDIKPENIMIRPDGHLKVLDFGLAKLTNSDAPVADTQAPTVAKVDTEPGMIMGTPQYMSPEQARSLKLDPRTDIFSLGAVIYEMIAGRPPFEGKTISDVIVSILNREPQPLARYSLDVPPELQRIVSKALRKDIEERYQTARDLLADLKSLKQQLEMEANLKASTDGVSSDAMTVVAGGEATGGTAKAQAAKTGDAAVSQSTSALKHLTGIIDLHKRATIITLMVLTAVAAGLFYFNRTQALTEKDAILISDFVNTTGDAVFDGALKQALAIQLEQSPFLNIFPEEHARDTLRYMGRSTDERITRAVGREICQRQGIRALLTGSISNLGRHYVIGLEAIDAQSGDVMARQQVEAESKEQVLQALGSAATKLREKLGESLSSIQKFDAPIIQATTSSLEALRTYSLGLEQALRGKYGDAIPFYKRAIELDPNFALAYASLASSYAFTGQPILSVEAMEKAFQLKDRTSEREKLSISGRYYGFVTGELDKELEVAELSKRTYPQESGAYQGLAYIYNRIGQYDKAIEAARESIRLNPHFLNPYWNLASAFIATNRIEEAKEVIKQAQERQMDDWRNNRILYTVAFLQGDTEAMERQVAALRGTGYEYNAFELEARAAAFHGQFRKSRELRSRSVELAQAHNMKNDAAQFSVTAALEEALSGNCQQAKIQVTNALSLAPAARSIQSAPLALAQCGEVSQAQSVADELVKRYPKDTEINTYMLPLARAEIEINRGNYAQAIQLTQAIPPQALVARFWPYYIRGRAYLRKGDGAEAAAEFQKILDHRGLGPFSVIYPLAHLGLGRAAVLMGDTATARKAYQDFFALWKDADPDIPILQEAKQEYVRLK